MSNIFTERTPGTFRRGELYASDYDVINEDNDIIADMFGVNMHEELTPVPHDHGSEAENR